MIDLAGYTYDDHKACIVCCHVAEDGQPVLAFAHDEDGDLQFTCGQDDHDETDWQLVGLSHLLEQIRSMKGLPVVPAGFCIERTVEEGEWSLERLST